MERKIYIDIDTKKEIIQLFKEGISKYNIARLFGFAETTILYIINPEQRKRVMKRYRDKNKEKLKRKRHEYYIKNKKEISERRKHKRILTTI